MVGLFVIAAVLSIWVSKKGGGGAVDGWAKFSGRILQLDREKCANCGQQPIFTGFQEEKPQAYVGHFQKR